MTIRFAGARAGTSPIQAWRCRSVSLCAANDNARDELDGTVLVAALRHFARHGLSAADRAARNAEEAHCRGDRDMWSYWITVCGQLDRRMSARVVSRLGACRTR